MKLVSFIRDGQATYGAVDGDRYVTPPAEFTHRFPDIASVLKGDAQAALAAALEQGIGVVPASVRLLPVIPNPGKIICVGLNYKSHVAETKRADSDYPSLFVRFTDSLAAHGDTVLRPAFSERFDWEAELAIVIGRGGRSISQADAFDHIGGYACFNDVSVRDWQKHTHQWTPGKNFPGTGPLGPWLVTADEVPDVNALSIESRLNGTVMQHASLGDLIFTIPVLIEYISKFTPLSAGDVIATGTPGGVGDRREPPVYMRDGDLIEIEIPGLGVLRNRIGTAA